VGIYVYGFSSALLQGRPLLANPADGQRTDVLSGAKALRQRGRRWRRQAYPPRTRPGRVAHQSGEVEVPKGIELEFLPARSPELMPSERLWPLINERVANRRLFEEMDDLEEALVERCLTLSEQPESMRSHTLYHWWPDTA
jgi:hypothetical protein